MPFYYFITLLETKLQVKPLCAKIWNKICFSIEWIIWSSLLCVAEEHYWVFCNITSITEITSKLTLAGSPTLLSCCDAQNLLTFCSTRPADLHRGQSWGLQWERRISRDKWKGSSVRGYIQLCVPPGMYVWIIKKGSHVIHEDVSLVLKLDPGCWKNS